MKVLCLNKFLIFMYLFIKLHFHDIIFIMTLAIICFESMRILSLSLRDHLTLLVHYSLTELSDLEI